MRLQDFRARYALRSGMYPGDLCEIIHQFRSSLWCSWGIEVNRWGQRQRESVGLFDRHGTLWFATAMAQTDDFSGTVYELPEGRRPRGRVMAGPVPCSEIPFASINTVYRDETRKEGALFRGGTMLLGWRPLLSKLCKQGFLRPDERLSALIGEDTWQTVPRYLWL